MVDDDDDEVRNFELARRRRSIIAVSGVAAVAVIAGLTVYLIRPSACAALIADLCVGMDRALCENLEQAIEKFGVSADECREAHEALEASLEGAPPAAAPYVRAAVLFELVESHLDPEQREQLEKLRR